MPWTTSLWAIGKYPIGASHYEQMLYSQIIHICLVSFKYEFHPVPSGKQMFRGYFFAVVKLTPNASTVASVLKKRLLSIDLLQKSMNDPSPALPELKGRGQDLKFFPPYQGGIKGGDFDFCKRSNKEENGEPCRKGGSAPLMGGMS